MSQRSRLLINLGALAVAFLLGSLSTALVLPALRPRKEHLASTVAGPLRSALPAVSQAAAPEPKAAPPAVAVVPAVAAGAKEDTQAAEPAHEAARLVARDNPIPALKFGAAPVDVPKLIQVEKKEAPQALSLEPDLVLQKKGLKRSGLVYILKEEENYSNDVSILWTLYEQWNLIQIDMKKTFDYQKICYDKYVFFQQQRSATTASRTAGSGGSGGSVGSGGSSRSEPSSRGSEINSMPANTRAESGGGVHSNPLFKDIKENKLFKDVNSEKKEPSNSKEKDEKSSSPHKLHVVLPRVLFQVRIPVTFEQCEYGMAVARQRYDTLELAAFRKSVEIKRHQNQVINAAKVLKMRYDALARDDEVMAALKELNKTERPMVALGPQADYEGNLQKMTQRQLSAEGIERKATGGNYRFSLVARLEGMTRESANELKEALADQQHQRKKWHDGEKQRQKRRDDAILKNNPKALKDLQKEEGFAEAERSMLAQMVGTRREQYVQNVATLRAAVDEAPLKIDAWKKENPAVKIEPIPDHTIALVNSAEATIKTEVVALEPEKTIFWVETIVNGKPDKIMMALEPGVKMVRISGTLASTLGIDVTDQGPPETVVLDDGREVPGRLIYLESIQVGPFKAENVECFVILDGFAAPPLLGASFLGRFSSQLDLAASKLTLTQVEFPAPPKPSRPGASAKSKAVTKKAVK